VVRYHEYGIGVTVMTYESLTLLGTAMVLPHMQT